MNRCLKLAIVGVATVFSSIWFWDGDVVHAQPDLTARALEPLNHLNGLRSAMEQESALPLWEKQLNAWRTTETYRKVSVAGELSNYLRDGRQVRMTGFQRRADHDLNVVAGRAAAAIEAIYTIRLAPIRSSPRNAELEAAQRDAVLALGAYRQGAEALASEFGAERPVTYLKHKYLALLAHRTPEKANQQAVIMDRLLADWYPIGKTPSELEAVAGPASDKPGETLQYRFDNGTTGICYDFKVEHGHIRAVTTWGLY